MLASDTSSDILAEIKPQELQLTTLDLAQMGIIIDGLYFYRNNDSGEEFMSLDLLRRSFLQLVADHYPMIVGRPTVNSQGQAVMAIDPANLCMPDIAEVHVAHPADTFMTTRPADDASSSEKPAKFFDVRRFYRDSGVSRLPRATYHKDHSAAIIRVLRFKDNEYVALAYSFSHALFDGSGMVTFMNHWAEYARHLHSTGTVDCQLAEPPVNSRAAMQQYFDSVEPVDPPFIRHFRENVPPLPIKFPAQIAPVLIASPDLPACEEPHLMHFTPANFERMRQRVDGKQTTNAALMSLCAQAMVRANTLTYATPPRISYVVIAYDGRLRADMPPCFTGNLSCTTVAPLPTATVTSSSYTDLAQTIKEYSSMVGSEYTKAVIHTVETDLGLLYRASSTLCNSPQTSYFGLSDVRYLAFRAIDFGFGPPEILSLDYFIKEGMSRLYPNYQDGGVDLLFNYPDANFAHLRHDEDLTNYADIIF
ncbi:hypothetical protein GGF44_001342 [Coemansia sp. RSA 1694]|nr:hypothetical protein GGF38_001616 [Coemansia sp. RSA 25]KAJ2584155.1 hypothetical protein GGH95_000572 [Coemansia sp. RSA 1836]KAJ2643096.1 hypothetical protein GGF44_001342 [Coemansia sp. RSA 1694]